MKIKVCGLRDGQNIGRVAALGVDWIGMVFNAQSERNVTMIPTHAGIIPDKAPQLDTAGRLPKQENQPCPADGNHGTATQNKPLRVGVFTDEMPQNIITRVVNFRLDAIELRGNEQPTLLRNLKATLTTPDSHGQALAKGLQVWKVIGIETADDLPQYREYEDCADMFVFDAKGSDNDAKRFDWQLLNEYHGTLPFIISGAIGPGDEEAIRRFSHPLFEGINLNSCFETATAMKDIDKLQTFIQNLISLSIVTPGLDMDKTDRPL